LTTRKLLVLLDFLKKCFITTPTIDMIQDFIEAEENQDPFRTEF